MALTRKLGAALRSLLVIRLPLAAGIALFAAQVAIIATIAAHPERFPADACCKVRADTFDPRAV
jgi:hypothetical protein